MLCDETKAEHTAPLYYRGTHWLSRVKVFHRVFELNNEIAILCDSDNTDDTNLFHSGTDLFSRNFLKTK
jgi:hypothetical protein